jgi:hypothetical protein
MESDEEFTIDYGDDFFGSLGGKTEALNEAHVIARIAFMNQLVQHDRCKQVLTTCAEQAGLLSPALKSQELILELTEATGCKTVEEFYQLLKENQGKDTLTFSTNLEGPEQIENLEARVKELFLSWVNEYNTFEMLIRSKDCTEIVVEGIVEFVKHELALPWAWVAHELMELSYTNLFGLATGRAVTKKLWYEPIDPPAPQVELTFQTLPGESSSQALLRLSEEIKPILDLLLVPPPRISAGKSRNPSVIEQQVDWFFRHKILGESINSIANAPDRDGPRVKKDRATIREGIGEAVGLLSIAPQIWADVDVDESMTKFLLDDAAQSEETG